MTAITSATPDRRQGVTAAEVAERFNVSAKTVRRWADTGRVPCYRAGNVLRFDLDAVEQALTK